MTFLNQAILLALAAVAIPILIHLLHRREARMRDWGAMRFLLASMAARQRRILLEEMLLMALRCALVALLVMAAARPFVPADSRVPWALVLPAMLVGAMCAGVAAVIWAYRRLVAVALMALAAVLLVGAGGVSAYEYVSRAGHWTGGRDAKDVAIVIDGSMSMQVQVDGVSNFDRAIATAREVVDACRPADAISLVLAGPMPQSATAGPVSDRDAVYTALASMKPTSGAMGLLEGLNFAASALDQGQNPSKQIVLITDGQNVGWDLGNEARWQFLASALARARGKVGLFCRLLTLPQAFDNCSVADITFSRRIVGTDRSVGIQVTVANAGTQSSRPADVQLAVDGTALPARRVARMAPGAAETVSFDYQFQTAGRHIVTARLAGADDLAADDNATRVIDVLQDLPVLLVEGAPSARPLDGAAAFIDVALAPGADETAGVHNLIVPTVVPALQVGTIRDFSPYRAVILADVPRLPDGTARALRQFVSEGGGLLIAPGERALPDFYNKWMVNENIYVAPAMLVERRDNPQVTTRPAMKSFTHPALGVIADPAHSDAGSAVIRSWWQLEVRERDRSVRVGATLETGAPLLAERRLGKGYVLMTAISLGRRDSNWPTLKSYVPMLHELVQYLAAPLLADANVQPGAQVDADLPFPPAGRTQTTEKVRVLTPSGEDRTAAVTTGREGWSAAFAGTAAPGLYDFVFPAQMTGAETASVPFVVVREPEESFLKPLQKDDLAEAARRVPLTFADTDEHLVSLIVGTVPGRETWRQLALFALAVLLAEIALARWITVSRKTGKVKDVEFGEEEPPPGRPEAGLRQPVGAQAHASGGEGP